MLMVFSYKIQASHFNYFQLLDFQLFREKLTAVYSNNNSTQRLEQYFIYLIFSLLYIWWKTLKSQPGAFPNRCVTKVTTRNLTFFLKNSGAIEYYLNHEVVSGRDPFLKLSRMPFLEGISSQFIRKSWSRVLLPSLFSHLLSFIFLKLTIDNNRCWVTKEGKNCPNYL